MKKQSNKKISASVSELKRLIVTLNNGIDESTLQQINRKAEELSTQLAHDKVLSTFVKMINALSSYMISKKNNLHKDALPLLQSLIQSMEPLMGKKRATVPQEKKQEALSREIAKYNSFKKQIQQPGKAASAGKASPIANLKAIILSLDWEISDEIILKLDGEVNKLKKHWKNSKIHTSFLQMFQSIGKYVQSKGAGTHPDAISLLSSLYKNFEQVVHNSALSDKNQQDILSREIQKFNQLKQAISSESQPGNISAGVNPMDDLIGTKVSNLSPVDDLIEEIHMLQDDGSRSHSPSGPAMPASSGTPENPEIKEVITSRQKNQPIPEIQNRLDAFFDEDEPMEDLAFADTGEEVVPYKEDPSSPVADAAPFIDDDSGTISPFEGDIDDDDIMEDELLFEDGSGHDPSSISQTPASPSPAPPVSSPREIPPAPSPPSAQNMDGMVPYDFEDEFFEDESESKVLPEIKAKPSSLDTPKVLPESKAQPSSLDTPKLDLKILETIKSTVAQCMFDGNIQALDSIDDRICTLEQQLSQTTPSEPQVLLKMFDAFRSATLLLPKDTVQSGIEGMLFCIDCLEHSQMKPGDRDKSSEFTLINACHQYIDFHSSMIYTDTSLLSGPDDLPSETDIKARPELSQASLLDNAPLKNGDTVAPGGFWSKLKRLFGLS